MCSYSIIAREKSVPLKVPRPSLPCLLKLSSVVRVIQELTNLKSLIPAHSYRRATEQPWKSLTCQLNLFQLLSPWYPLVKSNRKPAGLVNMCFVDFTLNWISAFLELALTVCWSCHYAILLQWAKIFFSNWLHFI